MSDHLLSQAPFLPSAAPRASVLDFSGRLSADDLKAIDGQIAGLKYQAKVVVMPDDFGTSDFPHFAQQLAQQWHAGGNRFLLVVYTKGHQVRGESGNQLVSDGISGSRVSDILKDQFVPYARQGNLPAAISNSLAAIDQSLPERLTATSSTPGKPAPYAASGTNPVQHSGAGWLVQMAILLAIGAAVVGLLYKRQAGNNKRLRDALNERLNGLYEKADDIGQGSEYLAPGKRPELARRVADFFNQMTVLDKAKSEVEQFERGVNAWKTGDGLLKCLRLADALLPEASFLLDSVNAVTGGTRLLQPSTNKPKKIVADGQRISIPGLESDRYKRPSWSYEPAYAPPPVVLNPGGGMMSLMLLLNQMEMNQRLDQIALAEQQQVANPGLFCDGGASWGDNANVSDSGWGDAGGGGFADGGADWGGGGGGADW